MAQKVKDKIRFAREDVRRILERAAAEQHRLDNELAETCSLEELEDMAAEAGVSREALRVAIERDGRSPGKVVSQKGVDESPRGGLGLLCAPGQWSSAARATVATGAVGLVLFGALIAFPVVAPVLFWITVVLLLLALLGAFPV